MDGNRCCEVRENGKLLGYYVECPGCGMGHLFNVDRGDGSPRWSFDGNMKRPTFTPSMLVRGSCRGQPVVCHSFVRDGKIQFLDDCTHALRGQTVDLPEVDP